MDVRACVEALGGDVEDDAVVDLVSRAAIAPALALDYCAHVASRRGDRALADLPARDLAIAFGCLRRDDDALAELEKDALVAARIALCRMGASDAGADEELQAIRARLLAGTPDGRPRIADYRGQGSLRRWVRAAAVHHYLNDRRDCRREVDVGDDAVLDALAGPGSYSQLAFLKQRYRAVFADAVGAAAGALEPEQRTVLRYTFVDGLSLDALGRALRVSRATAHRRLTDARAALLAATERELGARLALTHDEVVSMHRLVRSQLELSLARIFT